MTRLAVVALLSLAACKQEGHSGVSLARDGLTAEEVRGLALIHDEGCGTCHVIPEVEGANGLTGPPLTAMGRQAYVAGVVPNTPEALARFIMDPQATDPRSAMPDLGLDAEEAAAIAAFLYAAGGG